MEGQNRFSGRVSIVTGAGSGIGAETARLFASEGAAVTLVDIDRSAVETVVAEITAAGGQAVAVICDVRDPDQVDRAVAGAVERFGGVHILVNNAGVMQEATIEQISLDDFTRVMSINLTSAFLFSKAVEGHMRAQRYGKIVMTSSRGMLGAPGYSSYASSKAGMVGLAGALAWELGPYGINVNSVAPGHVTTPLTEELAVKRGGSYEDIRATAASRIALPDIASPRDIAEVIAFLASDAARFVTGQAILTTGRPMQ
ncbi:SDR family NAD(P)-dependent oxidoreductase [Nocardioides houyundeii]|uniref:SDR family NAD(P)-dependent oxidoreductase n=1 Tax=Nocardioides houyundeii TaxID=2045452 RepID=UPI000DF312DE|nr:SDR family NAD(P)-dependent oxidoreductase [Nocardioides houyundeii]